MAGTWLVTSYTFARYTSLSLSYIPPPSTHTEEANPGDTSKTVSEVLLANLSAPLSYPISVRYEAVRTTWRHKDDGELERGFITIKSLYVPSPQELDAIPCTCELQWAHWVTPAEPKFTCNYIPSDNLFVDFRAPKFLEDPTGMNLGYRDSDDEDLIEIGKAFVEEREPEQMITRYPQLRVEHCDVVDNSGHEFLLMQISFGPHHDEGCSSWESRHDRRKIWFKRVVEGMETSITEEERSRLAVDDSGSECSECGHSEGEDSNESSGASKEVDTNMGGNSDDE